MRQAQKEDIPRLVEMLRAFHAASNQSAGYDDKAIAALISTMIDADTACILTSDAGLIGGMLNPAYCDPRWIMAVEMFWWAKGDGMTLLRGFEQWAGINGANEIRMTTLCNLPRADALLKHSGYTPSEISYSKVT